MDAHCGKFFLARLLQTFGRGKQSFERNTPPQETGTPWWSRVNQGYMPPQLCCTDRGDVATWTSAEYEYVNCRSYISDYHRNASFCYTISSINCCGFSTSSLKRARKAPDIAPSIKRWSKESARGIMGRTITFPCCTTALSWILPTARMATSG